MVKNLIPIFDFISPKITLFYDGSKRYSTTIGGIFTIIIIFVGIFSFINQLLSFLNYDINGIEYYRKYIDNLASYGYEFNNNKNSIFIFANFLDYSIKKRDIELNKIRLVGIFADSENINNESFFQNDHWLFDNCDTINLEKDLKKLSEEDLKKAICLKYYYNSIEKQYYSINDKFFKTPKIERSSDVFNIYVHKCVNNSITNQIYGNCSSENEIIDYINNQIFLIKFSYLSHQINSNNRKNPDQFYINSVTSRILMQNVFSYNTLTFSPLIIERNIGLMFNNMITEKFYTFQGYKKGNEKNLETMDILNLFYIMFENVSHSYKYSYKTVYDLFAKTATIIEIVYYILFFINYILNLVTANINMQNIIFHKKLIYNRKIVHLFSENYKFNLGNKSIKTVKNPSIKKDNRNILNILNKNDVSKNKITPDKSFLLQLNESVNISKIEQINNIISQKKSADVCKINNKYLEDSKFGSIVFNKKDILLFFKYLVCNKWNNSPILLFDSIHKKLMSVEHLFQMHLIILNFKRNNKKTNLMDIYRFFYE